MLLGVMNTYIVILCLDVEQVARRNDEFQIAGGIIKLNPFLLIVLVGSRVLVLLYHKENGSNDKIWKDYY